MLRADIPGKITGENVPPLAPPLRLLLMLPGPQAFLSGLRIASGPKYRWHPAHLHQRVQRNHAYDSISEPKNR